MITLALGVVALDLGVVGFDLEELCVLADRDFVRGLDPPLDFDLPATFLSLLDMEGLSGLLSYDHLM